MAHSDRQAALLIMDRQDEHRRKYSEAHDDEHIEGELRDAAIAYLMVCDARAGDNAGDVWPWDTDDGWQPRDDELENLVEAAALTISEISRVLRKRERLQL